MFLYELDELEDITDTFTYETEESIFTDDSVIDFIESIFQLLDEYISESPSIITESDFAEILLEEIKDIFTIQLENIYLNEDNENDMDEILEDALEIYINTCIPSRSIFENDIYNENQISETFYNEKERDINDINENSINDELKKELIEEKINRLRNIPQPTQRTDEWYKYRHNLITASNAYKVFESQCMVNQLIYEKCQPLKTNTENNKENKYTTPKMINVNTTLHWGQKFEPLSVAIYEDLYNTKVEDFGCIPHQTYKFLGASPDGIIVNKQSERYGRMLEIKNIVNREITGIPKKEYWIQMQLQMEVCDLDMCDFLETKFTEYQDSQSFYTDGDDKTANNEVKGIILYFNTPELSPFYLYKPLNITKYEEMDKWMEEMIELYQSKGMNWIKNIYWKLEKFSCVLVLRNKEWFKNSVKQIEKTWQIIEKERITGYEHRAPNKKFKKDTYSPPIGGKGCLLNIIKVDTSMQNV